MRRSQANPEHAEAVSRRLATLSAELAGVRGEALEPTRVRGLPTAPPSAPQPTPMPVVVPVPGRHASRRGSRSGRLGERLGLDRLGLDRIGPWHVAVVMALVALAVGVAAWLVVGSRAEPTTGGGLSAATQPLTPLDTSSVEQPGTVDQPETGEPSGTGDHGDPAGAQVTVDVAGKVRTPGIAVLPAGSRVVDALEAAGGARRGVDLTGLNLARVLVDGEQILVGVTAPAGVPGLAEPGTTAGPGSLVNINTADQAVLETLPGVGPVTAQAIIGWRTDNGGFSSVDELVEVDGIGEVTMAKIAPLVTI